MTHPTDGPRPDGIQLGAEGARQVVRSPEQVELHLPVAGPASRMLAYAIDWFVILLLQILVFLLLMLLFAGSSGFVEWVREPLQELIDSGDASDPGEAVGAAFLAVLFLVFLMVQLLAEWGYFIVSELSTGGRTLGKRIVGLRVVQDGGGPLTPRGSLVRNLLRIVDMLPASYLVGLVSLIASPEGKRLGDLAAGTLVVRLDRPAPAPPLHEADPAIGDFRFEHAHLAKVGARERALLRQTLRRITGLDETRAAEAVGRAVRVLCARLGYPAVAEDEQVAFLHALHAASRRR